MTGPSAAPPARAGDLRKLRRSGVAVGIDLAGAPHRNTGFCVMDRALRCRVSTLHSDAEIWHGIRAASVGIVSIDAPLSLPRGRRYLADRSGPHFRECDLVLRERGIRFFPLTLGPMRMLTARGLRLRGKIERSGGIARESYPGAAQDILGIPRKGEGTAGLRRGLLRLGIHGEIERKDLNHDELDAITAAYVGRLWLDGRAEEIGDPEEGLMILPLAEERPNRRRA